MPTKTKYFYGIEQVVKIIDGDTIDCEVQLGPGLGVRLNLQVRLRFHGCNVAETRTRNKAEKAVCLRAKERLTEILNDADELLFESHGTGKFGRVLATPYAVNKNGKRTDIVKLLIREGHAREYHGGKRQPWFPKG